MADRWMITNRIEVRSRIKIQSGTPQFAHFDAYLLPSDDAHDGIRTTFKWEDSDDAKWESAVEEGVERFAQSRAELGCPVANTTLAMCRIISHPVATDDRVVSGIVATTLHHHFQELAVRIDSEET